MGTSTKNTNDSPTNQTQEQTTNPFSGSVFTNALNSDTKKASFNYNRPTEAISDNHNNNNSNVQSHKSHKGNSIFNGTKQPAAQSGEAEQLMNLLQNLITELTDNQSSSGTNNAQQVQEQPKKEKSGGGGFFGFLKKAVSTVAPIAMTLFGGGAPGGIAKIASSLFGGG